MFTGSSASTASAVSVSGGLVAVVKVVTELASLPVGNFSVSPVFAIGFLHPDQPIVWIHYSDRYVMSSTASSQPAL
jgi:hypothetical protein